MRVLFVGPYAFHPVVDASTTYVVFRDFMEALRGDVEAAYLLTGRSNPEYVDDLKSLYGIQLVTPRTTGANSFSRVSYIRAGARAVLRHRIDVVTNTYGGISFGFDALLIARLTGSRAVVRISGDEMKTRSIIGRYKGLNGVFIRIVDFLRQWLSVNFSDAVIAQSPWELKRLKAVALKGANHIHLCPRGADLTVLHPGAADEEVRNRKPFTVLYVGRHSLEKGYDLVVEVARALESQKDIRFLMAGDFQARPEANVEYLGFVHPNHLEEVYEQAGVVLLPSRTEGFPTVIGEALAMGKPCIVSRHLFEGYFVDGHEALLCELEPEDITEKILLLRRNPSLAQKIAQQARLFAERNLDRRKLGEKYKAILKGGWRGGDA